MKKPELRIWEIETMGNQMSYQKAPKEIKMGEQIILVDEEDFAFLSRFRWHVIKDKQTFYAKASVNIAGKSATISMHRMITGMRKGMVDHRNRNGLDNRKENLRYASAKENSYNRVRYNPLGFRGVFKPHNSSNYSYQIQLNGKRYTKRGYKTPEDAAKAYDAKSKELHGEFGIRNFED